MAQDKPSIREALKVSKKPKRCRVCKDQRVIDTVDDWLDMRESETTDWSVHHLCVWIATNLQEDFPETTLWGHIRRCRRDRWEKIRVGGRA